MINEMFKSLTAADWEFLKWISEDLYSVPIAMLMYIMRSII